MAVYVGIEFQTLCSRVWPYKFASHLFADSIDELHKLAGQIGLKRSWFQNHARLPHYDLTANKRRQAIAKGAIVVDRNFEVKFYRERRHRGHKNR
jgi:hypothetical protein